MSYDIRNRAIRPDHVDHRVQAWFIHTQIHNCFAHYLVLSTVYLLHTSRSSVFPGRGSRLSLAFRPVVTAFSCWKKVYLLHPKNTLMSPAHAARAPHLQREIVELVHHAVHGVAERGALGDHPAVERDHLVRGRGGREPGAGDVEPQLLQGREQ